MKFGWPRTMSGAWLPEGAVFQISTRLFEASVITRRVPSLANPEGLLNTRDPPLLLNPKAESVMSASCAVVKNPDVPPGATEYEVDG